MIFCKSYARYLGLDIRAAQRRTPRDDPAPRGAVPGDAVSGVEHEAVRRYPALPSLPLSGAGIAVVILAGLLVAAVVLMRGDRGETPAAVDPERVTTAGQAAAPEPPTSIVVRASGDVHLRVERGGAVLWDGFLTAGDLRRFDATSPTKLIVSQAAAISVFAGGRRIEMPETGPAEFDWPTPGASAP